ncbi:zinc finger, CCHC-type containing protein [Tanacetum coccineum]
MRDANLIRTLGDYSKPSHEGYRNTIDLPVGNNVGPFRSDTIRERTRLRLFQFSLRDQASNWLERLPTGSITIWEDLTTRFLAQFFPPGRTAKLRNNILMFQQHQGESLLEAWTRFKDLLQKCEIDRAASGKLRDKNADESWEIIKNLALYDHEGWNDSKEFVKPVKAISTPISTSKTPDQRLLELEDHINFLQKGARPTPRPSSMHIPQAYVEAVLGTTFEARVWDNMAAHTERMERFENAIFKQQEEINDRMAKMFKLLKELTTSRAPEKVLIREEAKSRVTKNVNFISLAKKEEERNDNDNMEADSGINGTHTEMPIKEAEKETEDENGTKNKPIKRAKREETAKASSSLPIGYYLKHRINEKLIEGLVDNHREKITRKEEIGGNFEIPCNIGGLKRMNALVDQGSDVNVMPLSTYMKLTDERPTETDIRLSLASYSYIYPLGIAEDVLVDVARYVYPVDFMISDIKEDEKKLFILGASFLTTVKAVIKFDKGTITLRSRNSKISFHTVCKVEKGIKNDIEPIAPIMTVNRLVLEWEEKIKLHQEKEMKFDQWRSKNFRN